MVRVLKEAMAQALVPYYAFAGEILSNSLGEAELLCNNRGVDFLEAYADVKLQDLNLYNPDESIEGKLAPTRKHGVLSVQVTELKCGGIVVAFQALICNTIFPAFSPQPSTSRLLCSVLDHMYVPISALPPPKVPQPGADPLISRLYYVTAEKLSLLQTLATSKSSSYKRTKLESLSAFLWKMVAKSAHMENANQKICKMSVVVDGRKRLSCGDEDMTTAMASYFGNVLSFPLEHFLGLIDWVEAHRPEPATLNMCCNGNSDGPGFMVSSGQRFPVTKVDFGWGRPALGSYHFPWGEEVGYVMPMPSPTVDGDWVVYMHS
ncbi:Anthranilate N-benzoyltransferase protein 3 [Vitis vinifera]|uniref:Anthranilate N-benzoyltransferase protein 3 n=1 Tax=Vitis vinifera TaxID=29760 RepID=A0A438CED2_VITVI|nr:Anthranilate N-benzoyltransferase protein 3 [Vitis vinifera]